MQINCDEKRIVVACDQCECSLEVTQVYGDSRNPILQVKECDICTPKDSSVEGELKRQFIFEVFPKFSLTELQERLK